jgi:predicted transposase/invertase (TIGR01784 family)
MSDTVIKHLAAKYEKVRKGVGESMGGKVLEYEAKDILNRGRAEGRDEGRREGRAEGEITGMKKAKMQLAAKLLQAGNSVAYVADLTELPEETVQKLSQAVEREDE